MKLKRIRLNVKTNLSKQNTLISKQCLYKNETHSSIVRDYGSKNVLRGNVVTQCVKI